MNYWIGWGIITIIYAILYWLLARNCRRRIAYLKSIINVKELQLGVEREIAENYRTRNATLKKQIEELKGAKGDDRK